MTNAQLAPSKPEVDDASAPTNIRYWVLAILASLSMITYLDRACFGQAQLEIAHSLGFKSDADLAWVLFAFTFAYSVFEIPSGWLGDVFGPHSTLIRIVIWWSFFTAVTAIVGLEIGPVVLTGSLGFGVLVAIRFMFGVGEAGAYPNITRALHNWFPITSRGSAQGLIWMSGRFMGGLTPVIWFLLVGLAGLQWRVAFLIFGVIGVLWCILFSWWFRNHPEEKPEVNKAELTLINEDRDDVGAAHGNVPWMQMLTSVNLWAICFMYFGMSFGWYFNITYLAAFMEKYYGIAKTDFLGSIYKGGPLLLGALGCIVGGFLTDWLVKSMGDRALARRTIGCIGLLLAAACFLACPYMPVKDVQAPLASPSVLASQPPLETPSALPFVLALSFAAFFNDMTMGSAWATCQDIGKKHAAIVAGAMNTIGNLGGAAANLFTGMLIIYLSNLTLSEHAQSLGRVSYELFSADARKATVIAAELPAYQLNFYVFAGIYVVSALLWLRIDANESVFTEDEDPKGQ